MAETVIGVFRDLEAAARAIDRLGEAGFTYEHISVVTASPGHDRHLGSGPEDTSEEGTYLGAIAGGLIGGLGGWLVGLAAAIALGRGSGAAFLPVAFGFGGTLLLAAVGALLGRRAGSRIRPIEPAFFARLLHDHGALVALDLVDTPDRKQEAIDLMIRARALEVYVVDLARILEAGEVAVEPVYTAPKAPEEAPVGSAGREGRAAAGAPQPVAATAGGSVRKPAGTQ